MTNDDIQPLTVTVEQAAKLLGIGPRSELNPLG